MLNVRIITIMPKKLTTEEWINKARIKHGDKYDYSKSVYTGSRDRIIITCPKHNTFVEYNGIQHYNPKMAFGGSFKFERQQARDEYVRQYCKDNNIKLIEIRYDEDVWEVLTRELLDNQTTNEECK